MFQKDKDFYTVDEYFTLEETAERRSEYYQGEIFALAGGSANHNRITGNIFNALSNALEAKPCETFISDMRLLVERRGLYTYPDVMVVCGQLKFVEGRTDTIINPIVIVEVLSKSTEAYDRGKKFEFYRAIETFEDYVLIDQERFHLEYFGRLDDRQWTLMILNDLSDTLVLPSIGVEIPLDVIYRNVDWEREG